MKLLLWLWEDCAEHSRPRYNAGTEAFPKGYMQISEVPREQLPQRALDFFRGGVTFGDMQDPLKYGKICPGTLKKTRLSDIQMALGWNFVCNEDAHMGFNIRAAFPTGNKPTATYLFEPIVGNGGHFELGLGFSSHLALWENDEGNKSLNVYFDINATHLFGTMQRRSFDFIDNDEGSRYCLIAEYDDIPRASDRSGLEGYMSNPGMRDAYDGVLHPAINWTTMCADVSVQLQADAVLKLSYKYNDWELDIGYNFWGRAPERVIIKDELPDNRFGLKGDSYLYGAASAPTNTDPTNPTYNTAQYAQAAYNANVPVGQLGYPIPLSAMQEDKASLFGGGNHAQTTANPRLNPKIDSPEKAVTRVGNFPEVPVYSPIAGVGSNPDIQINSSNPVDFIGELENLDPDSAASPSAITHKIFAHVSHLWDRESKYDPYLGVGFEVEFDGEKRDYACATCDCRAALNQWGIWIKGGIVF